MSSSLNSQSTRIIQLAHETVHYEIPPQLNGPKTDKIPADYLRSRINYAINRLLERLEISTAKHLSDRHDPVKESIDELRDGLNTIVDGISNQEIISQQELQKFCQKTQASIYLFKSDRERYLKHISQLAEIFYKTEQEIISTLFDLPKESLNPPADNEQNHKKDLRRTMETLTFTMASRDNILKNLPSPNDIKTFKESLDNIYDSFPEIENLLQAIPHQKMVDGLPKPVGKSILESIKNFLTKFGKLIQVNQDLENITNAIHYHSEVLQKATEAEIYFRGLVNYKNHKYLNPDLTELQKNLQTSAYLKNKLEEALKQISYLKELANLLLSDPKTQTTLLKCIDFNSDLQNEFSELKSHLTIIETDKQQQPTIENINNPDDIATPDNEQNNPQTNPDKTATGTTLNSPYFRWKNASPDEIRNEVVKRIEAIPAFSVIRFLRQNKLYEDLGRVLKYLGFEHLREVSLGNIVGKGKIFPDIKTMIERVLPETIWPDQQKYKVKIRTESGEKRFRWHGSNIAPENIRQEVRRRLYEYWPLLEILFNSENNLDQLHKLLRLMDKKDFAEAGLNISCFGTENSIYPNTESLIQDVFSKTSN